MSSADISPRQEKEYTNLFALFIVVSNTVVLLAPDELVGANSVMVEKDGDIYAGEVDAPVRVSVDTKTDLDFFILIVSGVPMGMKESTALWFCLVRDASSGVTYGEAIDANVVKTSASLIFSSTENPVSSTEMSKLFQMELFLVFSAPE
jgi:hypothetical protein